MSLPPFRIFARHLLHTAAPFLKPGLDIERPADQALLKNIQGNIVQAHGRNRTTLCFFRFPDNWNQEQCRSYIRMSSDKVSSAWDGVLERTDRRLTKRPLTGTFRSLGLSSSGLQRMGVSSPEAAVPSGHDFTRGMGYVGLDPLVPENSVTPGTELFDPVDRNGKPTTWDAPFLDTIDGVWMIGHAEENDWQLSYVEVATGLIQVHVETAEKREREPFGFVDGKVRPAFFKGQKPSSWWADLSLRHVLIGGEDHPHVSGSYLVVRKLEQNVRAFDACEKALKARLPESAYEAKDPGALLVGRHKDGSPLGQKKPSRWGDFDFIKDTEGKRCPFHSHVRKANPRGGLSYQWDNTRDAQFVRRSAVYGPREALERKEALPETGVGLLFLGYMASVGRQFLVMQKSWMGNPRFPTPGPDEAPVGRDTMVFGGTPEEKVWKWNHEGVNYEIPMLTEFVVPKGGGYFYIPTKAWLAAPQ